MSLIALQQVLGLLYKYRRWLEHMLILDQNALKCFRVADI